MAPIFALHLDHDGIALHRAAGDDTAPFGPALETAPLDAEDFARRVAAMRDTVLEEAPGQSAGEGVGTAAPVLLILPESQIFCTETPASGLDAVADEGRVRAALDGATPYDLSELVYDWREVGGTLQVAVVARETLDEARAFAEAHGFAAVGFLGAEVGGFPGLPRFAGVTESGAAQVRAGGLVKADAPVETEGTGEAPPPDTSPAAPDDTKTAGPATETDSAAPDLAAQSEPNSPQAVPGDTSDAAGNGSGAAAPRPAGPHATPTLTVPSVTFSSIRRPDAEIAAEPPSDGLPATAQAEEAGLDAPDRPSGSARDDASAPTHSSEHPVVRPEAGDGAPGASTPPAASAAAAPRVTEVDSAQAGESAASLTPSRSPTQGAGSAFARLAGGAFAGWRRKSSGNPRAVEPTVKGKRAADRTGAAAFDRSRPSRPSHDAGAPAISRRDAPTPAVRPPGPKTAAPVNAPAAVDRTPTLRPDAAGGSAAPEAPTTDSGAPDPGAQTPEPQRDPAATPTPAAGALPPRATPAAAVPAARATPPSPAIRRIRRVDASGTLPAPKGAAPSEAGGLDEAASLTVFGARKSGADARGRSGARHLGLALTLGLLAMMGLVAAWSLLSDGETGGETIARSDASGPAFSTPIVSLDEESEGDGTGADSRGEDIAALSPSGTPGGDASPGVEPPPNTGAPAASTDAQPAPSGRPETPPADTARTETAPPARTPERESARAEPASDASGIVQSPPARGAPPAPAPEEAITVSVPPEPEEPAPPARPGPAIRADLPSLHEDPLPPGTRRGPDGFIVPTDEGALAPGGYTVYEGPPDILPPVRPGGEDDDAAALPPEDPAESGEPNGAERDPIAEARPAPRPQDDVSLGTEGASAPPGDPASPADSAGADPAELGDGLATEDPDIRPRGRPGLVADDIAVEDDPGDVAEEPAAGNLAEATAEAEAEANGPAPDSSASPLPAEASARVATADDPRPAPRPETLEAEAERLREEAERAAEIAREEAEAAAAELAAAEAEEAARLAREIATATGLAVARAPEPRARPSNMAQIAARARVTEEAAQERQAAARAAATPEQSAPQVQTAAAAPAAQARGPAVARNQRIRPDVASNALVARQATVNNALRMNAVTLIGVYGSPSQRRALVRLPSGRYVKVQVGDRLDGGQVAAIDRDALRYVKSGRAHVIEMPSG